MQKIIFTDEQKNEIIKMYKDDLINTTKLGKLFNCSANVIQRILIENNIEIRPAKFYYTGKISPNRLIKNEQEVINMYNQDITIIEIAKKFNCHFSTIYDILKRNNVEIKGRLYFIKGKPSPLKNKKFEDFMEIEKAKKRREEIKNKRKFTLEEEKEILDLYNINLMKMRDIGKKFDCGEKPILRVLIKYNINTSQSNRLKLLISSGKIPRANKGTFKKGDLRLLGENNPLWNNGSSFEPYNKEFNVSFKKLIKERDGCCMLCNIGFEDLKLLKRKIHVHHMDYNKLNSFPQNCISLCNHCHSKTNTNRIHWTKFFQSLLSERYGYKYSETGEIILNLNQEKIN